MTMASERAIRPAQSRPSVPARIIVGVDDRPAGLAALRWAVRLARSWDVPLVAVRAWELGQPTGTRGRRHASRHLVVQAFDGATERAAAAGFARKAFGAAVGEVPADLRISIETPQGDPGGALARIVTPAGDILVIGQGRRTWRRWAMRGAVGPSFGKHMRCPVLVVPGLARGQVAG